MNEPSGELVRRCKQGEESAWRELILACEGAVTQWIGRFEYRLGINDVADLRQEVFRKVILSLENYQASHSFSGGLYQQTKSLVIDNLRKKNAQKQFPEHLGISLEAAAEDAIAPLELSDHKIGPDTQAMVAEDHRRLYFVLERLGPPDCRCRELIERCYFGGFSYEEIGQQLKMNAKTVSTALCRCLQSLRSIADEVFREQIPGICEVPIE
jgi:RNA polymerase sigma factor (sigma-70 family)